MTTIALDVGYNTPSEFITAFRQSFGKTPAACIKARVLQIIASQFVGQTLQERAGKSEMSDGINKYIAARQNSKKYWEVNHPAPVKTGAKGQSLHRHWDLLGRPVPEK